VNQKGCLSLQARRPITTFTGIEESIPAGFLSYNALQAKLERRFSGGLYLLNAFTYSQAIDNASGHLDTPNGDNSRVNLANLAGERGQSAYNQPLNDTLTVVWDLPFGTGRHFGANASRPPSDAARQLASLGHQYGDQRPAGQPYLLGTSRLRRQRFAGLPAQCFGQPNYAFGSADQNLDRHLEFPQLEHRQPSHGPEPALRKRRA
jgi:hypothetical protein